MMMNVSSRWFVALLVCLVVIAGLGGYKYMQIQAAIAYGESYPEPSESVEAVAVSEQPFARSFSTIGEIVAPQAIELRNEVEGLVTDVNFASGDRVDKGEVLVQLDVSEERARLAAAQSRTELARLALERAQRLAKNKSISEENLDQARANFDVARADVRALEAVIAKKTLRAPFDAVAGLHNLDAGEYLQANTDIVSLVGVSDHSWLDFNVPQVQGVLAVGQPVTVVLSDAGDTAEATVIARNAMASSSSRNIRYRARLEAKPALPANAVVKINVPMAELDAIVVPRTALLKDTEGDYVYVLEPADGEGFRAARRDVEVGDQNSETAAILSGLSAGERVATNGAFKLMPGILTFVRPRPAASAAGGE